MTWPGPVARAADLALELTIAPGFGRVGPRVRRRAFGWTDAPPDALAGRRALVTGATSGIGAAVAAGLVGLGATVHVVGRDAEKLAGTVADLRRTSPAVHGHLADLARLADVRALADAVAAAGDGLDVLAHVAGALVHERTTTEDGNELTAQVHVLAPFLLTMRLLPALAVAGGRVLTMSSGGMYTQRLDHAALLDPPGAFDGTTAYARAKRAQVELNAEWARRHPDDGVGFHALHPGWVDTPGLTAGLPGFARRLGPILRSPAEGADTAVWLASTPSVRAPGGDFWFDRRRRATAPVPGTAPRPGEVDATWVAVAARVAPFLRPAPGRGAGGR